MNQSDDYYRRVVKALLNTPGRRWNGAVVDWALNETDAKTLIDQFRDQFNSAMSAQYKRAQTEKPAAQEPTFTPGLPVCDSEERTMSDAKPQPAPQAVDARNMDDVESGEPAPTLQPGEIPDAPAEPAEVSPRPSIISRTESLPNGRSGQAYDAQLDSVVASLPPQLVLIDDGGSGLSLTEEGRLQGTPSTPGNYQLRVEGRNDQGEVTQKLELKLALIPNSRDLWKNLPSDPAAPYAKPDEDVARLDVGDGWHMAMASQRGRSHAHTGGQRDDHGVIARTSTGWNILVVRDGAGSSEFSRQGSLLATTTARDDLLKTLVSSAGESLEAAALAWWQGDDLSRMSQELLIPLQQTIITAVHAGHRAINEEAKASGHPVKAFATTLLLALHKETPQGHVVVTFGIGDGAIAALYSGDQGELLNTADSGQHASQTRFLDAPLFQEGQGLYQRAKVKVFSSLDALILATDGVTDPKFDSDNDMHDGQQWWSLFAELAPALPEPSDEAARDPLQEYLAFFMERHHDDRTIAVLHRGAGESQPSDLQEAQA